MRISDWISDVCSSDLDVEQRRSAVAGEDHSARLTRSREACSREQLGQRHRLDDRGLAVVARHDDVRVVGPARRDEPDEHPPELGNATSRARGCQYVYNWGVSRYCKKKTNKQRL